jgi:hypothetical protein
MNRDRPTIRSAAARHFTVAGFLLLTACSSAMDLAPNKGAADTSGQPAFSQFQDVPIPSSATMNVDRTLVFGARDSWIGRLAFKSWTNPVAMFDFYKQNTPQFGWEELTTVRSANSVLSYARGDRIMTVEVKSATLWGCDVDVTVGPRGGGAASASNYGSSPLPITGRAPSIPVQRD